MALSVSVVSVLIVLYITVGDVAAVSLPPSMAAPVLTKCEELDLLLADGRCMSCEAITSEVGDIIYKAKREVSIGCQTDEDCTLVFASTRCMGTCQTPVSKQNTGILMGTIKKLDDGFCSAFRTKCAFMTPMCMAAEAYCANNTCLMRQQRGDGHVLDGPGPPMDGPGIDVPVGEPGNATQR